MLEARPYRRSDFDRVFAIYEATMRVIVDRNFGWDRGFQADNLARELLRDHCLVYSIAGRVEAFSCVRLLPDEIYIFLLCVSPDCQRAGIGARMVRDLLDLAAETGLPMRGKVLPGSEALGFYETSGFSVDRSGPPGGGTISLTASQAARLRSRLQNAAEAP